jgi:hypothetical protein
MYDRRPIVNRDSRARLGRKLGSDYNLMPDPMLPPRLQDLVAILLRKEACEPQPTESAADKPIGMALRAV